MSKDQLANEAKDKTMELAEESRETEWKFPSFTAEIFAGNFRWELLHPYPLQGDEDKKIGDEFIAKLKDICEKYIDAEEIASSPRKVDIGLVGDCKAVLQQLLEGMGGRVDAGRFDAWRKMLADGEAEKRTKAVRDPAMDAAPIHPLRLCEEIKDFMQRDAILVVDGQEILNYGRQSMPTFAPGHRINSGPFGTMGVGLPFGLGAKVAKPDKQVIVVHGDGSFGMNAMELDTAVRHNIPLLVVISLNGGWTADPNGEKPGRDLGYTRYDKLAETLGCHGEYVEQPEDIRPALDRAQKKVDEGMVAVVNVKTDFRARAGTVKFSTYST